MSDPEPARSFDVLLRIEASGEISPGGLIDSTLRSAARRQLVEAPPPDLTATLSATLERLAADAARAKGLSAGWAFAEVRVADGREPSVVACDAGLPAGAPAAEAVGNLDFEEEAERLATGLAATPLDAPRGHAFACAITGCDPDRGLRPGGGRIETLHLPAGPGLRIEPMVAEGDLLPTTGAAEVVRLTAHAGTRARALARLRRAIATTEIGVRNGATDKAILLGLLERPEIDSIPLSGATLAALAGDRSWRSRRGAAEALLAAAVSSYEELMDEAKARFLASARRGRPEVSLESGIALELRQDGHVYLCRVAKLGPGSYRVECEGERFELRIRGRERGTLTVGGVEHRILRRRDDRGYSIEVDGAPHQFTGDPATVVRSPLPAIVSRVEVSEGIEVAAGAPLIVLEAMKMETTLVADRAGVVRKLLVRPNSQVSAGAPLLELEPPERAPAPADGPREARLPLAALAAAASGTATAPGSGDVEDATRLFLGYDLDARAVAHRLASATPPYAAELEAAEQRALRVHLDVLSLFRPLPDQEPEDDLRRSVEEYLFTYLRDLDARGAGLPAAFLDKLRHALAHFGIERLERTSALEEALFRLAMAHHRLQQHSPCALALLERRLERGAPTPAASELRELVDRLITESHNREPALYDLAREVRYRLFDRPLLLAERERELERVRQLVDAFSQALPDEERATTIEALVDCPQPMHEWLADLWPRAGGTLRRAIPEILVRRYYRIRELAGVAGAGPEPEDGVVVEYRHRGSDVRLFALAATEDQFDAALARLRRLADADSGRGLEIAADVYLTATGPAALASASRRIEQALAEVALSTDLRRVAVSFAGGDQLTHFTYRRDADGVFVEDQLARGLHPMIAQRLGLWRLSNFDLTRLPAPAGVHLFRAVGREDPQDDRLFAFAEIRDLTPARDAADRIVELPQLERAILEAVAALRRAQARRPYAERSFWNRIVLDLWPAIRLGAEELNEIVHRLAPHTVGLGLEKVVVRGRIPDPQSGELGDWLLEVSNPGEGAPSLRFRRPSQRPLKTLRPYARRVIDLRRRGLPYPYEIVRLLAPPADASGRFPPGEFVEHDLDERGRLVPVDRPPGENRANIVVGLVRNFTDRYPEGMTRVVLLGDASHGMGSLAEAECRRIQAGLELAAELGVPVEWFALSAGARIAMETGTENMDWIARVLRSLIDHTQAGHEVNVVVVGINVGAQPYWNAEATMLMHTKGILVMTPEAAMVLTGKTALDFSGGVSAEDNLGIGGFQRIMGPNGQAQYFARDVADACRILLAHYEHSYVAPGERFPRHAPSRDPRDRDVCDSPHGGTFRTVGEIFSDETNPGRKKPFEIRKVMAAVADQDHPTLERWAEMRDAEIGVVWDAHVGGHPVALLGFESRPLRRLGWVPAYGPTVWTGGTLFPQASKKIARGINAASGSRPLVVLANLSGFDGSPESMRNGQLEFGAEIGRAVVNFRGPIVFVVVSRYHGGAFVVFSQTLHDNMQVAALEGTYASVIGGAPAAAVVFAREVSKRTRKDPRVAELEVRLADPATPDKASLQERLAEVFEAVHSEKLGEVSVEYDGVHDVTRAQRMGSVHEIIPAARLRPWVIAAVERGMAREGTGPGSTLSLPST